MRRFAILLAFLLAALPVAAATRAAHPVSFAGRADVQDFVREMAERHGLERAALEAAFRHAHPLPAVIKAIMPPADPGVRSWQAYRSRFVEPRRIAAGRAFMQRHAGTLAKAGARYGVPVEIIAAVIGVETIYGRHTGRFPTFAALATLAFDYPPRAELFRRELEELLLLARDEGRSPLDYRGSYAGALGLPQFLPSSRRRFAVDFDDDGRIDLAASPADAIGSVANFLAEHGWERDAPIAMTVEVAGAGVQALVDEGIAPRRTPAEMSAAGVTFTATGAAGAPLPERPAALVDLVTPGAPTEYRLAFRNFHVITRYNRSSFYAAAVMDLAAALSDQRVGREPQAGDALAQTR